MQGDEFRLFYTRIWPEAIVIRTLAARVETQTGVVRDQICLDEASHHGVKEKLAGENLRERQWLGWRSEFHFFFLTIMARNLTFRLFHMDFKGFLRKGEPSCFTHFGSSRLRTGGITHSVFNKGLTDIEFAFVGSRQDDWLLVNKKGWSCHFQSCI